MEILDMEQKEKIIDIIQLSGNFFDLEITIRNKHKKNIYPVLSFYIKEYDENYIEFTAKVKNSNQFLIFREKIIHSDLLQHTEDAFRKFIDCNRQSIINKI